MMNKGKMICYVSIFILSICILHNLLFKQGFFGGSTYAYYNGAKVRVFKIRDQKALIAPSYGNGVIFSKTSEEEWVDMSSLEF